MNYLIQCFSICLYKGSSSFEFCYQSDIKSLDICQSAAVELNMTFKMAEVSTHYPTGCYLFKAGVNEVYFNKHENGKNELDSSAICKKQGKS